MEELILQKIQEVNEGLQEVLTYIRSHPQQITNIGTYYAFPQPQDIPTPHASNPVEQPLATTTQSTNNDINMCEYIVFAKIGENSHYGITTEERIDQYNRLIYRKSQSPFPQFVKFLKAENERGNLIFHRESPTNIHKHFVECYGELKAGERAFRDACFKNGWVPR